VLCQEIHCFFRSWLSEATSFENAEDLLVKESFFYSDRASLLAAKPMLFATLRVSQFLLQIASTLRLCRTP
jgi:hypothetical protein